MSDKTGIEWTDRTWNPTTGCDRVSPGCDHCYAMTMAKRLKGMGSEKYQRDGDPRTSGPGFGVSVHPDTLMEPLRWRKPQRVFVNSMSDLFHDEVPDGYIARVFAIMARAPQHTFQVLTKRHARMRSLLSSARFRDDVETLVPERLVGPWPLPNVWLGVSTENQQWADIRVPALLDTPAAVRFISAEPLLGPIDLSRYLTGDCPSCGDDITEPPCGEIHSRMALDESAMGLAWVIVGGESGRGARPMHPDWARDLRDQCEAAGVPFLFKQWGNWITDESRPADDPTSIQNVGKHRAGRILDGRTWDEFPQAVTA